MFLYKVFVKGIVFTTKYNTCRNHKHLILVADILGLFIPNTRNKLLNAVKTFIWEKKGKEKLSPNYTTWTKCLFGKKKSKDFLISLALQEAFILWKSCRNQRRPLARL